MTGDGTTFDLTIQQARAALADCVLAAEGAAPGAPPDPALLMNLRAIRDTLVALLPEAGENRPAIAALAAEATRLHDRLHALTPAASPGR